MRALLEALAPILKPLAGYVIAILVRFIRRRRFWRRVESDAKHALEDPNVPVSDPQVAAELAVIDAHQKSIQRIARTVRSSVPPPYGSSSERIPRIPRAGTQGDAEGDPGKSG